MNGAGDVIVTLHGRIGNQLFEFAVGHALARRTGGRLCFYDLTHAGAESYELSRLIGARMVLAMPRDLARFGIYEFGTPLRTTLQALSYRHAERRAASAETPRILVQARLGSPFALLEAVLQASPPVLLVGYYQREEYFHDYAQEIAEAISLPSTHHQWLHALPAPVVSITFRRGDYASLGWQLPLSFYANALERLRAELTPGSLLVFSDDPEFAQLAGPWLRERAGVRVELAPEITRDPLEQLGLLAACDHHVLANSSFCWWGAWLAEHRREAPSTVIAPAGWIDGDEGIVPARWLRVAIGSTDDD